VARARAWLRHNRFIRSGIAGNDQLLSSDDEAGAIKLISGDQRLMWYRISRNAEAYHLAALYSRLTWEQQRGEGN
jgi:hypothetical protein